MTAPKTIAFHTLGCKLNYSETSTIGRLFNKAGFDTVDFTDMPDVYVINTCSVTENADKKCKKIVREALKISPLYKWVYETASKDSFVSIEKAQTKLGYAPKFSNKQALIRNFEWYKANLAKFEGQSGVSHRVPWKQGILGVAKVFF